MNLQSLSKLERFGKEIEVPTDNKRQSWDASFRAFEETEQSRGHEELCM